MTETAMAFMEPWFGERGPWREEATVSGPDWPGENSSSTSGHAAPLQPQGPPARGPPHAQASLPSHWQLLSPDIDAGVYIPCSALLTAPR